MISAATHTAAVLAEGMGGDGGGLSGGTIAVIVVALAAAAGLAARSRQTHIARSRVRATSHPDAGVVLLHELPAPGAPPSLAIGIRWHPDAAGTVSLLEDDR